MRILILAILGFLLYRLVFQPAKEGYIDNPKPRILKKDRKPQPEKKPPKKDVDYTDYEEID